MVSVTRLLYLSVVYSISCFWWLLVSLRCLKLAVTKPRSFFYLKTRKTRPQCLTDPALGMHGYLRLKTTRLHYVAAGSSEKPLMVLLHGFPEFWYSWRHQVAHFSKDYRVVAVDMRGYGESDKPAGAHQYTLDKLTEDIAEFIPQLGYKSCVLIGHDWGGAVSWSLAAHYPHLVDKLVILNCPHPNAFMPFLRTSWRQLLKSWYMFLFLLPWLPELFMCSGDLKMLENAFKGKKMGTTRKDAFTPEDMEAFKYTFSTPGSLKGPINYIRAGILYQGFGLKTKVVQSPTLMIWGTNDGALCKELAELSGKYTVDFRLQYIEGASHWVQQDEPDLVNKYIQEFL